MTLYLDGERTPVSEVRDSLRLNFYIPEDRLQAELQPDPARLAFVIIPLATPRARRSPTAAQRACSHDRG